MPRVVKVGITTFGCDAGKSGVSQYLIRLLHEFDRLTAPNFEVLLYEDEKNVWLNSQQRLAHHFVSPAMRSPVSNVAWHLSALPHLARNRGYDVMWLPSANRRTPIFSPCPTVGTVHDFAQLHIAGKYDAARTFYQNEVLPRMIRRLTRIVTISESSKRDIMDLAKIPEDRITVIPHGVDHERYHPRPVAESQQRVAAKYGLRPPYVLYISRIEHPAKNHVRLINAFARIKAAESLPHQLVLAGGKWHGAEAVYAAAAKSTCSSDIIFTGFAPTEDLPDLYCGADVFIFPSLYEGFGMPILEAMACGVPVACSNVSSMPEVAGNAAVQFDPTREDAIGESLRRLLTKNSHRERFAEEGPRHASGFNWETSARRTVEVFEEALQDR